MFKQIHIFNSNMNYDIYAAYIISKSDDKKNYRYKHLIQNNVLYEYSDICSRYLEVGRLNEDWVCAEKICSIDLIRDTKQSEDAINTVVVKNGYLLTNLEEKYCCEELFDYYKSFDYIDIIINTECNDIVVSQAVKVANDIKRNMLDILYKNMEKGLISEFKHMAISIYVYDFKEHKWLIC